MDPWVEFPQWVPYDAPFYKHDFSPEAFVEFERYIRGLVASKNQAVAGINRLFVRKRGSAPARMLSPGWKG